MDSIVPQAEPRLHPHHLAELRDGSGISPEVIAQRGAYTVTSSDELLRLGFTQKGLHTTGYMLPIHTLNGWEQGYAYKPDVPLAEVRPDGTVKQRKYLRPPKSPNRLDVPPACRDAVLDSRQDLLITEGWKKADAAASHGLACVALGGVWNWLGKTGEHTTGLISDFGHIPLKGRKVAIVFDSDVATKREVRLARERLGYILRGLGALPYYVDLPPGPNGEKVGLDDYLLHNPAASVWERARDPEDERFAAMQRRLDEMQAELDNMRDEYRWHRDLDSVSNKALSPADKLALRDIRRATRRAGETAYREPQTLFYGERVKHTGQSPSSYSRSIQQLEKAGAIEVIEGKYENGKPKVSIVLKEAFNRPDLLARPK